MEFLSKKFIFKKTTAGFLILSLISTLLISSFFYPQKAQALIGIEDTVYIESFLPAAELQLELFTAEIVTAIGAAEIAQKAGDKLLDAGVDTAKKGIMDKVKEWGEKGVEQMIKETASKISWETAWAAAKAALKKKILDMLVGEIVNWIKGEGKPRFITDWKGFLKEAVAIDVEKFMDDLGLGFLCEHFSVSLKLALAEPKPFQTRTECSIWDVVDNVQDFYNDFSKGGWRGWISLTEPRNNFYGAYVMALGEKYRIAAEAHEAALTKGQAGAGILGDEVCTKCYWKTFKGEKVGEVSGEACQQEGIAPSNILAECGQKGGCSFVCTQTEIRTPGSIAGQVTAKALTADIDWIVNVTSEEQLAAYLAAIADAIIYRLTKEGMSLLD